MRKTFVFFLGWLVALIAVLAYAFGDMVYEETSLLLLWAIVIMLTGLVGNKSE